MAPRNIEGYVHGLDGPVVVVPARIAAWMERALDLNNIRVSMRGSGDTERDQVLAALHLAACSWRTSATGMRDAPEPEVRAPSQWLSTREAGDLLHITDRAVRLAINDNRLPAKQVGKAYRISREAIAQYTAARAA